MHFAWWLGPLEDNPVLGSTDEPTRLDLSTRGYTEYLRDFRALEWYRIPATTRQAHVTGPYVDHLCTCDYILTLTMPVHATRRRANGRRRRGRHRRAAPRGRTARRKFLDVESPLALVNEQGRVVLSTDPSLQVGRLAGPGSADVAVPGHPVLGARRPRGIRFVIKD